MSSVVLASDDTPKTLNGLARLLAAGEHNCEIRIGDIDALVEDARSTQNLRETVGELLHGPATLVRLRRRRHSLGLNSRSLKQKRSLTR